MITNSVGSPGSHNGQAQIHIQTTSHSTSSSQTSVVTTTAAAVEAARQQANNNSNVSFLFAFFFVDLWGGGFSVIGYFWYQNGLLLPRLLGILCDSFT